MERLENWLEWGGIKKDVVCLVLSGVALVISLTGLLPIGVDWAWVAIILCGLPIVLEAVVGLVTEFDIKADVLVSLALIAAVIIREDFAAGEVAFIMQLGALLEDLTVAKARAGIEKLVNLTPQTARRIDGTEETVIPAEQVKMGDLLRVLPGEMIPADGIVCFGETAVDQAVMTGESLPVDKGVGDEVSSGTVNQFGSFDMKATKVGEDSSIQRMIRLVQSADAGKAKIVGIADRWATWIVVIALVSAAGTWIITGEVIRAVTILVVFCPCALVLATPTAIMAAIGNATKHGFLVREGDALERLATVTNIAFDKTGTLTYGSPRVAAVKSVVNNCPDERIFLYAASAEHRSEHPLGKAIVRSYQEQNQQDLLQTNDFQMIPGRGVRAGISGKIILAGNTEMMRDNRIEIDESCLHQTEVWLKQGCTVIYLSIDQVLSGFLALSDTLREEAGAMITQIKAAGVTPVLLTGDHQNAARHIAGMLEIEDVHAECLPEDKLRLIDTYQNQKKQVCMIGDGVNDAPALKRAFVGIAMGGIGSDIAVDAADIALVNDEIKELPHLIRLSKKMMVTIKYNLGFSMTLNFIAIILAMTGVLNPVLGALVHNAGSIFVIIHSSLLLQWKK